MLDLYLLRHGKAANPDKYDQDFDRPLNRKGVVQANQVGYKLKNEGVLIEQLIFSSAVRTTQTANIVNHYLSIQDSVSDKSLYLRDSKSILEFVSTNGVKNSILYVGHNFGISDIASYLSDERISMSTCMMVHLSFDAENWNEISGGTGTIAGSFVPDIYLP